MQYLAGFLPSYQLFCIHISLLSLIQIDVVSQNERFYVKALTVDKNNKTAVSNIQIHTNKSASSVQFLYREDDDSLKAWSVFYKKNMQVFKSINLGEPDLGEPMYRFNCYLMFYDTNEITPLHIIENFKQSNFDNIHTVDNQLQSKAYGLEHVIVKDKLFLFGEEIFHSCHKADLVLTNFKEIQKISDKLKVSHLLSTIKSQSALSMLHYPVCQEAHEHWDMSCRCQTNVFIDWYPCASKPCSNTDENFTDDEDIIPYGCGVRSCAHKHQFVYLVENLKFCFSD